MSGVRARAAVFERLCAQSRAGNVGATIQLGRWLRLQQPDDAVEHPGHIGLGGGPQRHGSGAAAALHKSRPGQASRIGPSQRGDEQLQSQQPFLRRYGKLVLHALKVIFFHPDLSVVRLTAAVGERVAGGVNFASRDEEPPS